jgi:hypothetical protein
MRLQWLVPGTHRKYVWVMEKVHKHARFRREQPFRWAVVSHSMLFWNTDDRNGQPRYLIIVTYLLCLRFIFVEVFHSMYEGYLIKLADSMYCRAMCIVVLIILRKPVGCWSQQRWGICRSTGSSFCALRAFRVFIKHRGCVNSNYLSDNPYAWLR